MKSTAIRHSPARRSPCPLKHRQKWISKGGSLLLAVFLVASASIANAAPGGVKGKPTPAATPLPPGDPNYTRSTSNTSGTADQWSAGTNWDATPTSATNTQLVFGNGTPLAAAATIFTNNDISGDFKLNILNFTYAGPGSGTQPTVTVSGNRLEFISNGATTPTMSIAATGTVKPLLTISNDLLLTDNLTITATTNGTLAGTISGGGSLTKLGGGTLTLSGANTYSGGTVWGNPAGQSAAGVISVGTSSVGGPGTITSGPLGTGTLTVRNSGAASGNFIQSTDGTTRTISNAIAFGGSSILFNFGGTGDLIFDGSVTLGGGVRTFTVNNTNTTFSGVISGTSGNGVTKAGTGTLIYSGSSANTYNGLTTVNIGELDLSKTAGVDAIAGNLTIGDSAAGTATVKLINSDQINNTSDVTINSDGVFDLNGKNEAIDGLTASSGTASVTLNGGTFTVGANNQPTVTFAGVISTAGNLIKDGTGTQILTGNNTYTGTTEINANGGTLEINNSNSSTSGRLSGTSGMTVNSGGTLLLGGSSSWTDRINDSATMTLNGGTFSTGGLSEHGSAGIGALTLTATSTINFGSSNTSVIQFAGLGSHTDTTVLQITNWNGNPNVGGTGDQLLFTGTASSFTGLYDQNEVSFNGTFGYNIYQFSGFYEVTAVPEPGTWIGGSLALAALLFMQRRRFAGLARK